MENYHFPWFNYTARGNDMSLRFCFKDLVEKVMMLRKSIERLRNCEVAVQSPILAEKLTCYAGILAAEGSLTTAMTYLPENSDQVRGGFTQHQSPCF